MTIYRVTVTLADGAERSTAGFSDFGEANRWAMGYLRGARVGQESWVHSEKGISASYITGPTGGVSVSARAEKAQQEEKIESV